MKTKYREYPKVVVDAQRPTQLENRAHDIRQEETPAASPIEITLYTIDEIIVNHMQRILPTLAQDGKSLDVPVFYASPERWKTVQTDGVLRDKYNKFQLPAVVLNRTHMVPSTISSAVNKYNTYAVQQKYNRRNGYDRFSVQNSITPSEKYYSMMIPDYFDITYQGLIWTEYVSDMNTLTEAISFESDTYWGVAGNYRFRVEIEEFNSDVDLPETEDRLVRTSFDIKVYAYLLPQWALDKHGLKTPVTQINYSPKKLVTFLELIGTGETYEAIEDIPTIDD